MAQPMLKPLHEEFEFMAGNKRIRWVSAMFQHHIHLGKSCSDWYASHSCKVSNFEIHKKVRTINKIYDHYALADLMKIVKLNESYGQHINRLGKNNRRRTGNKSTSASQPDP